MTQQLIDLYQIRFVNKVFFNTVLRVKKIKKSPEVGNIHLFNFLNDWQDATEINNLLLPDIVTAINNLSSEIENGSETIMISIFHNKVDFYTDTSFVYSIPTLDFKEIVIGWRDFLLTPPLNGNII